jgi:hypothetical protein
VKPERTRFNNQTAFGARPHATARAPKT